MNEKEYLNVLGDIDEEYINSADSMRPRRRRSVWPAAAAACLAVGALTAAAVFGGSGRDDKTAAATPIPTEQTAHAGQDPAAAPDATDNAGGQWSIWESSGQILHDDSEFVYGEYLIYQNAYYDLIAILEDGQDLVGERIGEVTTERDGIHYIDHDSRHGFDCDYPAATAEPLQEHTGGWKGAIYGLKGYDAGKIVCQRDTEGRIYVFCNITTIDHITGADLFENCLSIKARRPRLQFVSAVKQGVGEIFEEIDGARYGARIEAFVDALCAADWVPAGEAFPAGVSTMEREGWLRLVMDDGMEIRLTLMTDGRVLLQHGERFAEPRALCLDLQAAEGVAELIRGRFQQIMRPETTLQQCIDDPWLGAGVPKAAPSGCEFAHGALIDIGPGGDIEPGGSGDGVTREIQIIFCGEGGSDTPWITVDIASYEYRLDMCTMHLENMTGDGSWDGTYREHTPVDEFTEADIIRGEEGELDKYYAYVRVGDIAVCIRANGATKAQIMELIRSIG